jgi:hypothetical protein
MEYEMVHDEEAVESSISPTLISGGLLQWALVVALVAFAVAFFVSVVYVAYAVAVLGSVG